MGGKVRLEAVTQNFRAIEGKRTTFVLLNETHHWIAGNHGHKMYETIDGNATKRTLDTSPSPTPTCRARICRAEDARVVREDPRRPHGRRRDPVRLDRGAPEDAAHPEALLVVIPKIRGDAVWLRPETIIQSIQDPRHVAVASRRMWLNQIVAEEDALYGPAEWDPLASTTPSFIRVTKSPSGSTAARRTTHRPGGDPGLRSGRLRARDLGEARRVRAGENWIVPREQVDSAVHESFRLYNVRAFYADVALWESYITDWSATYGEGLAVKAEGRDAIGWDMRSSLKRATMAHERLMSSIFNKKLFHDGDRTLRRHVLNARRRTNNHGVSFGKESASRPARSTCTPR
jgi:hypothetical protein